MHLIKIILFIFFDYIKYVLIFNLKKMAEKKIYDVIIIWSGVSGAAQLYSFAKHSDVKNVALIEKHDKAGMVNSMPTNNSQTLHEWDIETNYNLEKATSVKMKSGFTRDYVTKKWDPKLSLNGPKMVMGIGEKECEFLEKRFEEFSTLFPTLQKLEWEALKEKEPNVFKGRDANERILALYNPDGLTVNYSELAQNLVVDGVEIAKNDNEKDYETFFSTEVLDITKTDDGYIVKTNNGEMHARYVSVCAGAHSMYFAKKAWVEKAKTLSLLCVAGNFYYTPKYIDTKIYTVQDPDLPFSAVHGDPDILDPNRTRFGPTTRMVFMLERHKYKTVVDFFVTLPPVFKSLISYVKIMSDLKFALYAFKHNVVFQVPGVGNYYFWKEAQKIIPSLKYSDVKLAKGQGWVRPQIVDTTADKPLNLGEAKLAAENIRFNVTPSPWATTCIFNGLTDSKEITELLWGKFEAGVI